MRIFFILLLLISNAISLKRNMLILYNRIVIIALLYAILKSLVCFIEFIRFNRNNMVMSSPMAITISMLSLAVLLFFFISIEFFDSNLTKFF